MRKDVLLGKKVKAIVASAMALTLAVPSAIMLNQATEVEAALADYQPIKKFTFTDLEAEGVELVDNGLTPEVVQDTGSGAKPSKVLVLDSYTQEESTNSNGEKESVYTYSEAKVPNPFLGLDLEEEPELSYGKAPVWEKGVTIGYWQKTAEEDSAVISFSNERENIRQADSQVKRLMFEMYEEHPDDPAFAKGEEVRVTPSGRTLYWPEGQTQTTYTLGDGTAKGETYTVLSGCGIYVGFNPEIADSKESFYYMEPTVDQTGKITSYTLQKLKYTFKKDDWWEIDGKEVASGTAKGGLQFNASGEWGYIECGNKTDIYLGGKETGTLQSTDKSLVHANHVAAHAYVPDYDLNGDEYKLYQEISPLETPGEWKYITRVIKNDGISTYIDGEKVDEQLYTDGDGGTEKKVICGSKFNLGWGYDPYSGIVGHDGKKELIYANGDALYILTDNYPVNKAPAGLGIKGELGYNGNVVGITILEMLMNEGTTLSFGGQSYSVKDALTYVTGTSKGTAIDDVVFYDVPLEESEVKELYDTAVVEFNTPDSGETYEYQYGDVNMSMGDPDMEDALLTLQIALGIKRVKDDEQFRLANVDGIGDVTVDDALLVLQRALGIIRTFPVEK